MLGTRPYAMFCSMSAGMPGIGFVDRMQVSTGVERRQRILRSEIGCGYDEHFDAKIGHSGSKCEKLAWRRDGRRVTGDN